MIRSTWMISRKIHKPPGNKLIRFAQVVSTQRLQRSILIPQFFLDTHSIPLVCNVSLGFRQ